IECAVLSRHRRIIDGTLGFFVGSAGRSASPNHGEAIIKVGIPRLRMNDRTRVLSRGYALALGILLSAIVLVAVLHNVDWRLFWEALRRARIEWAALACVVIASSVYIRCWRWKVVSGLTDVSWSSFWLATVVGYVGNAIYPARLGDVMRVVALQ